MKSIPIIALLVVLAPSGSAQSPIDKSSSAIQEELVRIAQQLYDAIPSGDKSVWEKYVADDVIYTDENWRVLTKKQLIDSLTPLPKGYSGSIRIVNVQSRITRGAAVLSYRALEEEYIFGQKLSPIYLVTDTYFRRNGRWQMVASHVIVLPSERKFIAINRESYKSIIGEYQLTPGITYKITLEGDKLIGQRTGRAKEELVSADDHTFFPRGTIRGEKIFVLNARGEVIQMLDRRENNDLVWKKTR